MPKIIVADVAMVYRVCSIKYNRPTVAIMDGMLNFLTKYTPANISGTSIKAFSPTEAAAKFGSAPRLVNRYGIKTNEPLEETVKIRLNTSITTK